MQKKNQMGTSISGVGYGCPSYLLDWLFSCHSEMKAKNNTTLTAHSPYAAAGSVAAAMGTLPAKLMGDLA
jgi:hypothetical protein